MARTGTEITRMAEELMTAYNQSDWEKIRTLVAPDVVYIENGKRAAPRGCRRLHRDARDLEARVPGHRDTVLEQLTGDDVIAEEVRWEGTHTGPLETPNGTIEATNKRIGIDASAWYHFGDGTLPSSTTTSTCPRCSGRSAPCRNSAPVRVTTEPPRRPPPLHSGRRRRRPDAPPPTASRPARRSRAKR